MRVRAPYALPAERRQLLRKAVRLEWWTLGFMVTIIVAMYLAMGSSQTMKVAWIEDLLSMVPPLAFLVAHRYGDRRPTARFPYGHRRAAGIAFFAAAMALAGLGLFLLVDSAIQLIEGKHPTVGAVEIFGRDVWMGWVMIGAMTYGAIPPMVLGWMKHRPAERLHEKTLHTDAAMNKANWTTAAAGILGILGIGHGLWWADGVAAGLIALDVLWDGVRQLRGAVGDLMDQRPTTVDRQRPSDITERVRRAVEELPWVAVADVRLREEGILTAGEVYVVPRDQADLLARLVEAEDAAHRAHWRVHDVVAVPLTREALERHQQVETDLEKGSDS